MRKQGPFMHELLFILNMNESEQLVITGAHTKSLTRILDDDDKELSSQMGSATGIDLADPDQLAVALGPVSAAMVAQVADLTQQLNAANQAGQELETAHGVLQQDFGALQQQFDDVSARAVDINNELMHVTRERDDAAQREQALIEAAEIGEQQRLMDAETIADLRRRIEELKRG